MASSASTPKVWLITGCSSGIGRQLAIAALARGDKVIATARSESKLEDLKTRGAHPLALDVTWSDEVLAKSVGDAIAGYGNGRIDILVNNAGYYLEGAVEECSAEEALQQFNTNVFGLLSMCRVVLPYMRAQKSGVVANVGSCAGWQGFTDIGMYCGSKFAVAGLSESLRGDVAHLGIEVTVIEPGYFRTSFLESTNTVVVQKRIPDLDPVTAPIHAFIESQNGKQAGDPVKGAQVIVEALTKTGRCEGRTLPARLPLGRDAVKLQNAALALRHQELDAWAEIASTTDFDDAA